MDHLKKRATAAVPVLPDDALADILSRVPAKSLCRFKCVSKPWRDLIAGRLRCTNLPQTLAGFFYAYQDADEVYGCRCDGCSSGGACSDRVRGHFVDTSGRSVPLASFSFLGRQPEIKQLVGILRSCNGLVLFGHRMPGDSYDSLGYVVCNPATEQWVTVPPTPAGNLIGVPIGMRMMGEPSDESDSHTDDESNRRSTYMIFNPSVSPHFQLVEFWTSMNDGTVEEVHTYSSETGVWCQRTNMWDEDEDIAFYAGGAFVNGMLHLSATSFARRRKPRELIVAVDGEGKNRRVISGPNKDCNVVFIGESQGHLHFVDQHRDKTRGMAELSIWVLQDYDAEEWVLKHSVSFSHLFGKMDCQANLDFRVIAIHPDRNLIFFCQHWDLKLKSYDMDSQEVCIVRALGVGRQTITPYVPYFAESPALASKH